MAVDRDRRAQGLQNLLGDLHGIVGGRYLVEQHHKFVATQPRHGIDGTHHIPLAALAERLDEVPRDRTVYVMCALGGRSARATQYLSAQGVDAVNIDGGITEWHRAGLPVTIGGVA